MATEEARSSDELRTIRRRQWLVGAAAIIVSAAVSFGPRAHVASESLPARIADRDFWRMIVAFSEPGGSFRSDNLISNETTFQHVIPRLQGSPKGVYIGVGPDQNFTYISALKPAMAFIVDIRRQNMLLHLMYKAIIELSRDRAEFLSRLFARPRPAGLGAESSVQALFDAYSRTLPNEWLLQQNLRDILDRLETHHGFTLTEDDEHSIRYVYTSFVTGGPDIKYSFPRGQFGQYGGRWFPSYAQLMLESDLEGDTHSYVATEELFATLRSYEQNNLIVPIVGDFGGDKALRSVGRYVREHNATVTQFYTSNVEQYLFQGNGWRRFFANVAELPIGKESTFIRAYFNNMGYRSRPDASPGFRSSTLLDPIGGLLADLDRGQIQSYGDVVSRSQ